MAISYNKYCLGQIGTGLTYKVLIGYDNSCEDRCTSTGTYTINDGDSVLNYEAILVEIHNKQSSPQPCLFYIGGDKANLGNSGFYLRVAYKNESPSYYCDFYFSQDGKTMTFVTKRSFNIRRIIGIK